MMWLWRLLSLLKVVRYRYMLFCERLWRCLMLLRSLPIQLKNSVRVEKRLCHNACFACSKDDTPSPWSIFWHVNIRTLIPKVYDACSDDWKMWSRTSCFIWPLGVLYHAGLQRLPFRISGLSENTQFQKGSGIPCFCGSSQNTKVICTKCTWMRRIVLVGVLKVTKEVGYIRRTSLAPQYCMVFRSIPCYGR